MVFLTIGVVCLALAVAIVGWVLWSTRRELTAKVAPLDFELLENNEARAAHEKDITNVDRRAAVASPSEEHAIASLDDALAASKASRGD